MFHVFMFSCRILTFLKKYSNICKISAKCMLSFSLLLITRTLYRWEKKIIPSIILRENPDGIYLFKINNGNTRAMCEICSKLTINTPERRQWLLNLNRFYTMLCCFHCWQWTSKYLLGNVDMFTGLHFDKLGWFTAFNLAIKFLNLEPWGDEIVEVLDHLVLSKTINYIIQLRQTTHTLRST